MCSLLSFWHYSCFARADTDKMWVTNESYALKMNITVILIGKYKDITQIQSKKFKILASHKNCRKVSLISVWSKGIFKGDFNKKCITDHYLNWFFRKDTIHKSKETDKLFKKCRFLAFFILSNKSTYSSCSRANFMNNSLTFLAPSALAGVKHLVLLIFQSTIEIPYKQELTYLECRNT